MRTDGPVSDRAVIRAPQSRGDCTDFFDNPRDVYVEAKMPVDVLDILEAAAERTGRTFTQQLMYALEVCLGSQAVDLDDPRTMDEWKRLLPQVTFFFEAGKGDWTPTRYHFDGSQDAIGSA